MYWIRLTKAPLEGANIVHLTSQKGTTTNAHGTFEFRFKKAKGLIHISYLGYQPKEIEANTFSSSKNTKIYLVPLSQTTEEITVKAQRENPIIDVPARIEVISVEELKSNPASGVDLLLNYMPGVQVNRSFGIFSDKSVVSLRGMGGHCQKRTLVCVDGLPINKSDGGSINWNLVNGLDLEKIEVIKGPASALFGNNAMGGVINLKTVQSPNSKTASVDVGYGSYNTRWGSAKAANSFNLKNDRNLSASLYSKFRESDGYVVEPEEYIEEYDSIVEPLFLKEWSVGGRVLYQHKNFKIGFSSTYFDDDRGRGIKVFERQGAFSSHKTWRNSFDLNLKKATYDLSVQAYNQQENYFKTNEYLHDGEYKLYDVDARRTDRGLVSRISLKGSEWHKPTAGVSISHGATDAVDLYYTSTDKISNAGQMASFGAFLQEKITLWKDRLELYAGLRYDRAIFYNGRFEIEHASYSILYLQDFNTSDFGQKSWGALSPKVGLEFSWAEKAKLYLSHGTGFSAPLLEDLCRTSTKSSEFHLANPALGPETISNSELGLTLNIIPKVDVAVSVYSSTGKDFMYSINTGDSVNLGYKIVPVMQMQNISEVGIDGFECSVACKPADRLKFQLAYTQNKSIIEEFDTKNGEAGVDLSGKHLVGVPAETWSGKLTWGYRRFFLMVQAKYTGERWINEDNTMEQLYLFSQKYPAYFTMDAQLSVRFFDQVSVRLKLENLMDEIYINSKGQRNPGRFVTLGVEWDVLGGEGKR